jgi:3-oxoacyl-[acyl-carrier protein] reductase
MKAMPEKLLKGKKAIVTGGARGLGKEIVVSFLREGASVWSIDLLQSDSAAEVEQIARENGVQVAWKQADVTKEAEITALLEQILQESGGIEILVNNAGITRDKLLFRMTLEDWEKVLTVNLTSIFLICKVVAREMTRAHGGAIINMASVVGMIGNGGQTNYSASKAGLIGFTKSLAREVASRNVRVNAVAPGFIDTDMTRKLPESAREALTSQIPLGRIGQPSEVASVVTFLASEMASYLTGNVIQVTGGLGM